MNKIVVELPIGIKIKDLNPENISPSRFYVARLVCGNGRQKFGIIRSSTYRSDYYNVYAIGGLTYANAYGYDGKTLLETMLKVLKKGDNEVYEFETAKEFFQFLADNVDKSLLQ